MKKPIKYGYLKIIENAYKSGYSITLLRAIKQAAITDMGISYDAYTEILERMHFYFGTKWEE